VTPVAQSDGRSRWVSYKNTPMVAAAPTARRVCLGPNPCRLGSRPCPVPYGFRSSAMLRTMVERFCRRRLIVSTARAWSGMCRARVQAPESPCERDMSWFLSGGEHEPAPDRLVASGPRGIDPQTSGRLAAVSYRAAPAARARCGVFVAATRKRLHATATSRPRSHGGIRRSRAAVAPDVASADVPKVGVEPT
jgi:hypothetical protein